MPRDAQRESLDLDGDGRVSRDVPWGALMPQLLENKSPTPGKLVIFWKIKEPGGAGRAWRRLTKPRRAWGPGPSLWQGLRRAGRGFVRKRRRIPSGCRDRGQQGAGIKDTGMQGCHAGHQHF